ncbi:MAG TPA: glycosyltransferase, partial [Solirubrobacteraceae bacterium]|nr:glycosyltransferase [Solirubrobacteraceae bacterium]
MVAALSPPAAFGVDLDPGVRRLSGGRVLLGGDPMRLLRLSSAGAALVDQWERGAPVGRGGALARRLIDAGVAHPLPRGPAPGPDQVAIVIPVHDDAGALERCLRAVGETVFEILVVDDGSGDPETVRAAAARGAPGARMLRRERSGGPAAARNEGLRATSAPLVAFLDSDCEPQPGWL